MRLVPVCPLAVLALAACASPAVNKAETTVAKALISDQEENQLGDQVHQSLAKQGVKYLSDPQVVGYVQQVAGRVLTWAKKDRPGVDWKVYVIDDPKNVNAFATPGGDLYVYTGLLLAADNEAELAGVWGHESGHVVARHSARQMLDTFGAEALAGMVLGNQPSLIEKLSSNLLIGGAMLAHSRADETAADEYGARYASAAGYDPHELVHFFQKLHALQGKVPRAMKWLSDHPLTPDRIAHLNAYIAQHHLTGSDIGADRLAPIKAKLGGEENLTGSAQKP